MLHLRPARPLDWIGREGELRRLQLEVAKKIAEARGAGDPDYAVLYSGQTAGLIDELMPAGQVVTSIVSEAESIIHSRLPGLVHE